MSPVGAFISGGLDSSLVAAIAARHASSRLRTCAIVFPEEPAVEESRYANLLAKHIGSEHTEVEFRNAEIPELIASAVRHMEEPLCTSPSMVSWKLFRQAGPMKVALSGEGADEIFAGYPELRWKVHYRLRRFMPPLAGEIPRAKSAHPALAEDLAHCRRAGSARGRPRVAPARHAGVETAPAAAQLLDPWS